MKTMLKSARMRIMRRRACVRVVPVASVLEQDSSMTTIMMTAWCYTQLFTMICGLLFGWHISTCMLVAAHACVVVGEHVTESHNDTLLISNIKGA